MSDTKVNTIFVKNPVSETHIIHVHPKQDFVIQISDDMGSVEIDPSSTLFRQIDFYRKDDSTFYHFSQTNDLSAWAKISCCHLGDIGIISDKTNKLSNVSVILECDSIGPNKNVITIINPKTNKVKLRDNQLLHVVLFDKDIENDWGWGWVLVQNNAALNVNMRLVGSCFIEKDEEYLLISSKVNPLIDMINPMRRCLSDIVCENHLWFKCESEFPMTKPDSTFAEAGSLIFMPKKHDKFREFDCEIYLNLRSSKKKNATSIVRAVNKSQSRQNWNRFNENENDYYSSYFPDNTKYHKKWEPVATTKAEIILSENSTVTFEGNAKVVYFP